MAISRPHSVENRVFMDFVNWAEYNMMGAHFCKRLWPEFTCVDGKNEVHTNFNNVYGRKLIEMLNKTTFKLSILCSLVADYSLHNSVHYNIMLRILPHIIWLF